MIRVSVLYPNKPNAKFDHDYYANNHMRMVTEKCTPLGLVKAEIDRGIAGAAPNSPPPYVAIGYILFNSVEELQTALMKHNDEFMADIPNYTNIEPQVQISEVVM